MFRFRTRVFDQSDREGRNGPSFLLSLLKPVFELEILFDRIGRTDRSPQTVGGPEDLDDLPQERTGSVRSERSGKVGE
jgi:hypothetical protein